MKETITSYIGLDVHKDSIAIAVAEAGRSAPRFIGTTAAELAQLCKALRRSADARRTLVVYEAGPCGYGWARHLNAHAWRGEFIAPSRLGRSPAEQRSRPIGPMRCCRTRSRAATLVIVVMADARDAAMRDLSRTREDAVAARRRARLSWAMLLRHGPPTTVRTPGHRRTSGISPRSF